MARVATGAFARPASAKRGGRFQQPPNGNLGEWNYGFVGRY